PEVGELDDVLALIVMAEDDQALPELAPRRCHPLDQFTRAEVPVLPGDVLLPVAERGLARKRHGGNARIGLAGNTYHRQKLKRRGNGMNPLKPGSARPGT